jgi:hypothetical protein
MTNNIQTALQDVLDYANKLQQNQINIREKFSKRKVDYESLLEEVEGMIEDIRSFSIVDDEIAEELERAKINKDVLALEDIKSDCEYYIDEYWGQVQNEYDYEEYGDTLVRVS